MCVCVKESESNIANALICDLLFKNLMYRFCDVYLIFIGIPSGKHRANLAPVLSSAVMLETSDDV